MIWEDSQARLNVGIESIVERLNQLLAGKVEVNYLIPKFP